MNLELSLVVLEYHSLEDLKSCLESFYQASHGVNYEVIISSNSCYSEEKQAELREEFKDCHWVFNASNLGFAGGVNAGVKQAAGEYILQANVDLKFKTPLKQILDWSRQHSELGVVGPQILNSKAEIQDSARPLMTPLVFVQRMLTRFFRKKGSLLRSDMDYSAIQRSDWVIGAAMLLPRSALKEVGLLDPGYFLYVEDMDWCFRFWRAGFEVWYNPHWQVEYEGDRKSTSPMVKGVPVNRHSWYHIRSYLRFLFKYSFKLSRPSLSQ